jgi:hypothetical protein
VVVGSLTVIEGHRIAKEVESCLKEEIEDLSQVIIHVDPDRRREERPETRKTDRNAEHSSDRQDTAHSTRKVAGGEQDGEM